MAPASQRTKRQLKALTAGIPTHLVTPTSSARPGPNAGKNFKVAQRFGWKDLAHSDSQDTAGVWEKNWPSE